MVYPKKDAKFKGRNGVKGKEKEIVTWSARGALKDGIF
ncbi:uncharacterized protein G2W53_016610 [Senna tora]|uniref:Uncharacterized protein n=1 Tax=Senna tora TaxID=362788 RepID=A0A834TQY4_9FABA|nr:uncharacterized protein G2W53_016610 [Senna tora]